MLKIIIRIIIILAVAGIVGGGLYLAVTGGLVSSALVGAGPANFGGAGGQGSGGPQFTGSPASGVTFAGNVPADGNGVGGRDEQGGGAGWPTVLKNLGIIALITAGVVALQKVARLLIHRRPVMAG